MMFDRVILEASPRRWVIVTGPLYPDTKATIDWAQFLPRNVGTKHQREYLLESVKGFLIALINYPSPKRNKNLSHLTILNWVSWTKRLVKWMIARNVWRFSQLNGDQISQFLTERTRRDDDTLLSTCHQYFVKLVRWLWDLRHDYIGSLRINPATIESGNVRLLPARHGSRWKALDESDALPLIRDAIQWIETHGSFLIEAVEMIYGSLRRTIGFTRNERDETVHLAYATLEKDKHMKKIRALMGDHSTPTCFILQDALTQTEGACLIVLLFLIGFRCSELVRLDVDTITLDRCKDGTSIHRIKGIAAKQGGAERTWVASEHVIAVIEYIKKLYEPLRRMGHSRALFVSRRSWGENFLAGKIKRITPQGVATRIKLFASANHRMLSVTLNVHPHSARKTFARFVVLRDKRALESLSYHFGHTHRMITDGYYVGSDIELARLIDEEGRKDLANGLEDILRSSNVGGKAGRAIHGLKDDAATSEYRGRLGLKSLLKKLIDQGVQLAPCDWGYCVYSQSLSACRGSTTGPNEANRSPEVCSGCANFVVTETHRMWWSSRQERDAEFLRQSDISDQSRAWVERRMVGTEKVLRDIYDRRNEDHETSSLEKPGCSDY